MRLSPRLRTLVPLSGLLLQALALAGAALFTSTAYDGEHAAWMRLDPLMTDLLLGALAVGGLLALWGLYLTLAYARARVMLILIPLCILPSLILGAIGWYMLLAFLPII